MGLPGNALTTSRVARLVTVAGLVVGVIVPITTLPHLPAFSPWPVAVGLAVWTVGKYLLCPVRWYAISMSGRPVGWHLTVYAESELLGLVTPGHLGGDLWRIHRLSSKDLDGAGLTRLTAATEIATDKLIGAIGIVILAVAAAATLPTTTALTLLALAVALVLAGTVVHRTRPRWWPAYRLPGLRHACFGVGLSVLDQLTTLALLIGTLAATGHHLGTLATLTALGASQLAGFIPGPQGASPRDAALVVALVALGVPWAAALGAVTLKAMVAFVPGLLLGGGCLLLARRRRPPGPNPTAEESSRARSVA